VKALAHHSWPPITKKHNKHILTEKSEQTKRAKVNGIYKHETSVHSLIRYNKKLYIHTVSVLRYAANDIVSYV